MLILGHVGITFGAALAAESFRSQPRSAAIESESHLLDRLQLRVVTLSRKIDLRVLLIGALLPDIIDKTVGMVLFPGIYGAGRLFAHSLLFVIVVALAGVWRYRTAAHTGLLVLAYGSAMHLLLDAMWRTPSVLWWPFAGQLPRGGTAENWPSRILETLLTNHAAYVPEIAGGILLVPLLSMFFRGISLRRFLREGTIRGACTQRPAD